LERLDIVAGAQLACCYSYFFAQIHLQEEYDNMSLDVIMLN